MSRNEEEVEWEERNKDKSEKEKKNHKGVEKEEEGEEEWRFGERLSMMLRSFMI